MEPYRRGGRIPALHQKRYDRPDPHVKGAKRAAALRRAEIREELKLLNKPSKSKHVQAIIDDEARPKESEGSEMVFQNPSLSQEAESKMREEAFGGVSLSRDRSRDSLADIPAGTTFAAKARAAELKAARASLLARAGVAPEVDEGPSSTVNASLIFRKKATQPRKLSELPEIKPLTAFPLDLTLPPMSKADSSRPSTPSSVPYPGKQVSKHSDISSQTSPGAGVPIGAALEYHSEAILRSEEAVKSVNKRISAQILKSEEDKGYDSSMHRRDPLLAHQPHTSRSTKHVNVPENSSPSSQDRPPPYYESHIHPALLNNVLLDLQHSGITGFAPNMHPYTNTGRGARTTRGAGLPIKQKEGSGQGSQGSNQQDPQVEDDIDRGSPYADYNARNDYQGGSSVRSYAAAAASMAQDQMSTHTGTTAHPTSYQFQQQQSFGGMENVGSSQNQARFANPVLASMMPSEAHGMSAFDDPFKDYAFNPHSSTYRSYGAGLYQPSSTLPARPPVRIPPPAVKGTGHQLPSRVYHHPQQQAESVPPQQYGGQQYGAQQSSAQRSSAQQYGPQLYGAQQYGEEQHFAQQYSAEPRAKKYSHYKNDSTESFFGLTSSKPSAGRNAYDPAQSSIDQGPTHSSQCGDQTSDSYSSSGVTPQVPAWRTHQPTDSHSSTRAPRRLTAQGHQHHDSKASAESGKKSVASNKKSAEGNKKPAEKPLQTRDPQPYTGFSADSKKNMILQNLNEVVESSIRDKPVRSVLHDPMAARPSTSATNQFAMNPQAADYRFAGYQPSATPAFTFESVNKNPINLRIRAAAAQAAARKKAAYENDVLAASVPLPPTSHCGREGVLPSNPSPPDDRYDERGCLRGMPEPPGLDTSDRARATNRALAEMMQPENTGMTAEQRSNEVFAWFNARNPTLAPNFVNGLREENARFFARNAPNPLGAIGDGRPRLSAAGQGATGSDRPSTTTRSAQAAAKEADATDLLAGTMSNLLSYEGGRNREDPFARYAEPPAWAIDNTEGGSKSFFENLQPPPARVGRDPRYPTTMHEGRPTYFENPMGRR